jgi:rSAM/selenodomain-associated transferase 2
MRRLQLSVVIPTLNEATELPETLRRLRQVPEVTEILVSDGGSTDATEAIARQFDARFLSGPRGRGGQLRRGAQAATGDVVLLLHADTWVPPELGRVVQACLADPRVVGGACLKAFRDSHWLMRGSRFRCRLRMRLFQFAYGDQAIFVRREVLERIGGVPDVPLMEEHLLCPALRREGRLTLAPATVTTSARRFRERGVLRTYWRMFVITLRWRLGASPEELARSYSPTKPPTE